MIVTKIVAENALLVGRDVYLITMTLYHVHHVGDAFAIGTTFVETGERVGQRVVNPHTTICSYPYSAVRVFIKRVDIATA